MSNLRQIAQRQWFKGLNAAHAQLGQLPGILARLSNLVFTKRGGLLTSDGSLFVTKKNNTVAVDEGAITCLHLFQPQGVAKQLLAFQKDPKTHIGPLTGLVAADGGAAGTTFGAGTYYYVVTARDGAGGETPASNEASIALAAGNKVNLTWNAVTGARSYSVWRGTSAGNENLLWTDILTNSWVDDNGRSDLPNTLVPPIQDTTQVCQFYNVTDPATWTLIKTYPADSIAALDRTPGGFGGGGDPISGPPSSTAGTGVGGSAPNPAGGNTGNVTPLPQMLTFTDKVILCLGNGYKPQIYDGTTASDLSNTFVSSYPAWTATTSYNTGDIIKPATPNGHIYIAKQAGKSGGSGPTFPTTSKQVVADGSIIWQEYGSDTAGSVPPGAAHGIVHAGALWLGNTNPTNTTDLLDGPSALRMSDVNNPNSWNPINAAFIGKDDGTQIMGLATFAIAEVGIPPQAALVVFKEFSTYMIQGVFGSSNFSIQQAQTDLGCIAPRSIQFVPGFGIIRLTHLGIAVFDGVRDRIISEEVRPYLFGATF